MSQTSSKGPPFASLPWLLLACVCNLTPSIAAAEPQDFSFTGSFAADDDASLFAFTVDGVSQVTLRTYGYAGGAQADGNVVPPGGFDPILSLFDADGVLVAANDDGLGVPADPATGAAFDTEFAQVLEAGTYIVAVTQFDNEAIGPNLSDGFAQTGDPFFSGAIGNCSNGQFCDITGSNRTRQWAFDLLGVETANNEDNCPFVSNPDQRNSDRFPAGDACQCGDLDGDGNIDGADVEIARAQLVGRSIETPFDITRCNVVGASDGGESDCDLRDIFLLRRIASGVPGAAPGDVCQAYSP